MTANHDVAWGWRYTLGALTWLDEAILPGRIFEPITINPYTNTISILFGCLKPIAIKEGGRASRHAIATIIPANLRSREFFASHFRCGTTRSRLTMPLNIFTNDRPDVEQEGYHLLYPAYGAHLGSDSGFVHCRFRNIIGAAIFAIPRSYRRSKPEGRRHPRCKPRKQPEHSPDKDELAGLVTNEVRSVQQSS